jgi:hypothetical protein
MSVPAGTKMPTPVPPGRFAEYAAAISEGFCPRCRQPFTWSAPTVPGITWGDCSRCGGTWELNRRTVHGPGIRWRGTVEDVDWDVWVNGP